MNHDRPKPLTRRDRLRGIGYLMFGLLILALVVHGLVRGDLSSRHKDVLWNDSPILFSLNALALAACTVWSIRRGLRILANKPEA